MSEVTWVSTLRDFKHQQLRHTINLFSKSAGHRVSKVTWPSTFGSPQHFGNPTHCASPTAAWKMEPCQCQKPPGFWHFGTCLGEIVNEQWGWVIENQEISLNWCQKPGGFWHSHRCTQHTRLCNPKWMHRSLRHANWLEGKQSDDTIPITRTFHNSVSSPHNIK